MMVILRENVENLGKIGDLVKVSEGYARNFLLPRRLVVFADATNVKAVEAQKKALEKKRLAMKGSLRELADKIGQLSLTLKRKTAEKDRLFGSVTSLDIVEEIKLNGFAVEKAWVQLEAPIKAVGAYSVPLRLDQDVTTSIKVSVVAEG